jgi:hypothetical protein
MFPEVSIETMIMLPQRKKRKEHLQAMKRDRHNRQEGVRFLRSSRRLQTDISSSFLTRSSFLQNLSENDKHESQFSSSQTMSASMKSKSPVIATEDASTQDDSMIPSSRPTFFSSQFPSSVPSPMHTVASPTFLPSYIPTYLPSNAPTGNPSSKPIDTTNSNTVDSSSVPSSFPSSEPTTNAGHESVGQTSTSKDNSNGLQLNIAFIVVTVIAVVTVLVFLMRKRLCSLYPSHEPISHQEDIELLVTHDLMYGSSRQIDKPNSKKEKC